MARLPSKDPTGMTRAQALKAARALFADHPKLKSIYGDSVMDVLNKVIRDPARPLSEVAPLVPPKVCVPELNCTSAHSLIRCTCISAPNFPASRCAYLDFAWESR